MLQQRLTRNLYTGQTEPLTAPLSFDFTEDLGNKRNLSLLSQYGGAAAAYSLRALGSYNNHVVRVRRASDNDEKDFTASQVSSGELVNWVNAQTTLPLDLRELEDDGRTGDVIPAAAAYSLRNLSTTYTGNVVDVRRNDGTEESFTAAEVSDGTLEAWVLAPVSSLIGNKMYFDGVDDYVGSSLSITSFNEISLEATVTLGANQGVNTGPRILSIGHSANDDIGLLYLPSTSKLGFRVDDGTPSDVFEDGTTAASETKHIIGTYNGTNLKLYIDGALQIDTDTVSFNFGTASGTIRIGDIFSGLANSHFIGVISDVKIYDKALSDAEVTQAAAGTLGLDDVVWYLNGYGNTNADWEDQIGSNDGTVNGSPALYSGQGFDGFVAKWYDQSGNGRDAVQATTTAQPKIVSSGSLITRGGNPAIECDGLNDFFNLPSTIDTFTSASISTMFGTWEVENFTTNSFQRFFANNNGNVADNGTYVIQNRDNDNIIVTLGNNTIINDNFSGVRKFLYAGVKNGTTSYDIDINALNFTGTPGTGAASIPTGNSIGGSDNGTNRMLNGWVQEFIFYHSDESSNKTAIRSDINSYYSIY